jgi:serine/threonine protein kinase HipA of HipAB toxin-antitoxin module
MTSYCTYAEVLAMTGTAYPQATVEAMIVLADKEMNAMLAAKGIAAAYTDTGLQEAGLNLTMARVLTRMRIDGTKPDMLTVGGLTMKDSVDAAITGHRTVAAQLVQAYIDAHTSSGGSSGYERADRSDADMSDFALNSLTMPTYGDDD